MLTAYTIYPFFDRQLSTPGFVIPIPSPDPTVVRKPTYKGFESGNEFLFCFGAAQINTGQLVSTGQEMRVIIYKTRYHHFPMEVGYFGIVSFVGQIFISYKKDSIVFNRDCFGMGIRSIACPDTCVDVDSVCLFSGPAVGG